jgi:hypothetical protein
MGMPQARMVKLDEITGRFFDPTKCLLNMIDEVQFGLHRNVRQEFSLFWRHLKNLVTAETLPVEIKNGPTYQAPNTAAIIMAGNSDGFIPMEEMDRRLWLVDNNARELKKGTVDRLFDMVKATGKCANPHERVRLVQSLRYCLKKHAIQMDLATIRAPMTELKISMIRASMTDSEEWIHQYFDDKTNLLAAEPIMTHSSLAYILKVSEKIMHENWRENVEPMIREYKRRGVIRAIRRNGAFRRFTNIPTVLITGDIAMVNKDDVIYAMSDNVAIDDLPDDEIRKMFFRNLQTLKNRRHINPHESIDVESLIKSV